MCVEGAVEGTTAGEGADESVRGLYSGDGRWAIITRIDRKVDLKPRAWPCPRQVALALALARGSRVGGVRSRRRAPAVQHVPCDHICCCEEEAAG